MRNANIPNKWIFNKSFYYDFGYAYDRGVDFRFFLEKHDFFAYICQIWALHINFPKKKRKSTPSNAHRQTSKPIPIKNDKMCMTFPSYNWVVHWVHFAVRWLPPFCIPIPFVAILQFLPRLRRRIQVYSSWSIGLLVCLWICPSLSAAFHKHLIKLK